MSNTSGTGGPAFPDPQENWKGEKGMSLRDYFAGKVIQGLMSRTGLPDLEYESRLAYKMADAMLKERAK